MNIEDLLIDFDEMGFAPTTICPNPDEYACEWKMKLVAEINRQQAKIEALKMDNNQLESDIIIANNNYEHIKGIWENDHQKLSQVIAKWKDKYQRLVIQEEDIKAEAVKEVARQRDKAIKDFEKFAQRAFIDNPFACQYCVHSRGNGLACLWKAEHEGDKESCLGRYFKYNFQKTAGDTE